MNQPLMIDARLSQDEVKKVYNGLAWIYDVWGALTEGQGRRRGIELTNVTLPTPKRAGASWDSLSPMAVLCSHRAVPPDLEY